MDIVINNAGVVSGRAFCELDDGQIELTMAVNAMAPMWVTKAFLPAMMERDSGHIVTVTSATGLLGAPRLVDYCASKHASIGFMEALRVELKRLGSSVCTTTICPGIIDTGMFDGATSPFPLLRMLDPVRTCREALLMLRSIGKTDSCHTRNMPRRVSSTPWRGVNSSFSARGSSAVGGWLGSSSRPPWWTCSDCRWASRT